MYRRFKGVIIISLLLGAVITSYLIVKMDEPYSAFYVVPDSIQYSGTHNMVSFTFGILSHEKGVTRYTLDMYAGDTLERTREYDINPQGSVEYHEVLPLPANASLPMEIRLQMKSSRGDREEAHFWVRNGSSF
jgi:hypothetical protein